MYKISDLIGDWEDPAVYSGDHHGDLPIKSPEPSEWKTLEDPNRIMRMFKFSEEEKMNAFLMDVLEHQAETTHHGRITIQYPQVKVEVWTKSLNDVTEVDFEWAQVVSEIFEGYNE